MHVIDTRTMHDQSRQAHEVLGLLALREVPGTPVYNSADDGTVYAEQVNAGPTIGNGGQLVSMYKYIYIHMIHTDGQEWTILWCHDM